MVGNQIMTKNRRTKAFQQQNCKETPAALVRWYDYINSTLEQALLWGRAGNAHKWDNAVKEKVPSSSHHGCPGAGRARRLQDKRPSRNAESCAGVTTSRGETEYDLELYFMMIKRPEIRPEAVKEQDGIWRGIPASRNRFLENAERRSVY